MKLNRIRLCHSRIAGLFLVLALTVADVRAEGIPRIDLNGRRDRFIVVVDREAGQYLGHPTTVLLEDGKTILAVYPKGHGKGAIVLKKSTDGGRTWSPRLPTPENWTTSKETPTIHRVVDPAGKRRLILFSGLYPIRESVSEDDGATWSPLAPIGDFGGVVTMASVERLKEGRYMALFHDDGRFLKGKGKTTSFRVYKTVSADGGLTWGEPEVIVDDPTADYCEPGLVRSPDGKQIAVLLRENSRKHHSAIIFSDDEGKTWTKPRELPASLTGDRHTGKYAPDGRLFISFRDMDPASPTKGDWVGWVGTYDDLIAGRDGQYKVRILDNHKGADCAYPGVEVLPDGTFVVTTYGHWDQGMPPYVVAARFTLKELDALPRVDPLSFPRARPLEPAKALESFRVQKGFRVDLLAAEPLVTDPVAAAYDEDGRLYVVEMSDYPHVEAKNDKPFAENLDDPPVGRVRLLIDRDGDGDFDESHILADKLSWPTGVVCWKGGVFVAATPDIWYLKDTDGDHRADVRTRVFTGFRKFNVQAVMNNLAWGLDHKIYGAGSSNGGTIRRVNEAESKGPGPPAVPLLRNDFRFDPASKRFEVISGGARFGNTFDDWGNRFICDIRNPAEHVVLPARYLARNPDLPAPRALHDAAEAGDTIRLFRISPAEPWREYRARRWASISKAIARSELVGAGFLTSSSGVTSYRGDAYPASFRGNLFLGEVANNLIHRMAVEPDGTTFRARRADKDAEFLASTDTWFRPVNFVNAPDGTLHVLDMYRETIEHPWSIPDDIRARLDLRSGEDRGRIYRLTPPGFHHRPAPKLSKASTVELVGLLGHPNGWHAETAHRLIYERQDRAAIAPLKAMLGGGPSSRGRLLALHALAGLNALADDEIAAALGDASPHVRERAVLLAEPRVAKSPDLRAAVVGRAGDDDARVRFQVAFSLGEIAGEDATRGLAAIARRDSADPWTRAAVLSSASNDPVGLFEAIRNDRCITSNPSGLAIPQSLAVMVGARKRPGEAERLLKDLTHGSEPDDDESGRAVLLGLADGLARSGRRLADLRGTLPSDVADWLDREFARAAAIAPDEAVAPDRRAGAVELLGQGNYATATAVLPALLDPRQPPQVQAAAVKALAGFDRPEVAGHLLAPWKNYAPSRRAEVVGYLLGRRAWIGPLLAAVRTGVVPAGEIPATRRAILANDPDPVIRDQARALLGDRPGPRAEAVAKYKPAAERAGDPSKGRAVFDRECQACHKLGDRGHAVGPNLAGFRRRTPEEVLVHILDPNRETSPEFIEYTVALGDGRVVTGLVASETPSSVTLRGREGTEQTILRRNIAEIAGTGKSLMPEGFEKTIPPAEMADLIAFILTLQD